MVNPRRGLPAAGVGRQADVFVKNLAFLVLAAATTGCSTDIESSLAGYSFASIVHTVCTDALFSQAQYYHFFKDLSKNERLESEQRMQKERAQCAALQPIYDSLEHEQEELSSGLILPRWRYLFRFSVSKKDVRPVGFFDSRQECDSARKTISSVGFEVGECYRRILLWRFAWV